MAEEKRYFWLRLYDDFFTSKRIKKLRREQEQEQQSGSEKK